MNKETPRKRAARQNAEWLAALADSRVLKFDNGMRFIAYKTQAERETAYGEAIRSGMNVERVKA